MAELREKPRILRFQKIRITRQGGKMAARALVRAMAKQVGFTAKAREELVLVTSELAENLAVHAQEGEIVFKRIEQGAIQGIQIESRDQGPGIKDIELAMSDGFSSKNQLGYGLGTVNRLMDEVKINSTSKQPSQTLLIARKFTRPIEQAAKDALSTFGVATKALNGSKFNGDGFFIKKWPNGALAAVIDGLGHGQYAHRATQKALNYLENHYDNNISQIFMGVNRQCLATRGVVMALARFSWNPGSVILASIGNISIKAYGAEEKMEIPVLRGVLGRRAPNPSVVKHPWSAKHGIVMHSDGLSSHWNWRDYPGLWEQSAPNMAKQLLDSLAKEHDDATVLVVRGKSL
ncbi:ATP-binding SpoIIE family protein phosphatase [Dethiosulfatarculus sandiegensis]|uniref:ATP-binding SpoIIE family protein phosphatase n=1 Tax=Dethiosulfatarculus sandiegensis TaxID=1429043 RepID=UPI0012E187E1|nr:ATP-binding SpoIIE family protein phosphatase [Dethiosulfatarculus sandiegensis]